MEWIDRVTKKECIGRVGMLYVSLGLMVGLVSKIWRVSILLCYLGNGGG